MLSKVTANSTISSKEMAQVIQQQGLSEKRIEEIYQARKKSSSAANNSNNLEKFEQTTAKIEKIQQATESK